MSAYNLSTVRQLITDAFDLEGLTDFCFLHFRPVYDQFQESDRKIARVRMPLEHADRKGEMARLLRLIQQENPGKYAEYAGQLGQATTSPQGAPPSSGGSVFNQSGQQIHGHQYNVAGNLTLNQGASTSSNNPTQEGPDTPALPSQAEPSELSSRSQGRLLKGRRPKREPLILLQKVTTEIILPLRLEGDEQRFVEGELRWLFEALDHLYQIERGAQSVTAPVGVLIPETAERVPTADNTLLPRYRHPDQVRQVVLELIEPDLTSIQDHLKNLSLLQQQETAGGAAAQIDLNLLNQLRQQRLAAARLLPQLAVSAEHVYGVKVTAPQELVEYMET